MTGHFRVSVTISFLSIWKYEQRFNLFSILVMDSTGKITDGFSEGNFFNPGNQLQCMAVKVNETERKLLKKVHHEFMLANHIFLMIEQ